MNYTFELCYIQEQITTKCDPSHYTIHSFFSGLNQLFSDIWPNIMEWASDQGRVATTNRTLVDSSNDTISHNHGKPSNDPNWAFLCHWIKWLILNMASLSPLRWCHVACVGIHLMRCHMANISIQYVAVWQT
jgi:hypothetical protein